jgi:hypothetical protein
MSQPAQPPAAKSLQRQPFLSGAGLASALGVFVCAQGCLVPQSVDELVSSPHPAPYFEVEKIPSYLIAPTLQLVRQGSLDPPCHCQIQIPSLIVHEDDPTVDLEARWFIDYDVAVPRSQAIVRRDTGGALAGTFKDATYVRRPLLEFDFDADNLGIATNGLHVLTVVVGETAAFDDGATTALPNRTPHAGFSLAEWQFTINVDVQQDRANCPQQLPSVRVCQ